MGVQKRILVVEDEEIILADLIQTLEKQGHQIAGTASSGLRAIEAATTLNPDVILMDVRLRGELDGLEAARRIRQRSQVAIVFVTAHQDAVRLAGIGGGQWVIPKPFSPTQLSELLAAIE